MSGIGQADDTGLASNSIQKLRYLLHLSEIFGKKYQVKLCAEKTKLLAFSTKETNNIVEYTRHTNTIHIEDEQIEFVDLACWYMG